MLIYFQREALLRSAAKSMVISDTLPSRAPMVMQFLARFGYAQAQYELAGVYGGRFSNFGGADDQIKFDYWLHRAANNKHEQSMTILGACYLSGSFGFNCDKKLAFHWLSKAASMGNKDSQLFVARAYRLGEGVDQDIQKSIEWYRKAAANGIKIAQLYLGEAYLHGNSVPKDIDQAIKWYRDAASNPGDDLFESEPGAAEFQLGCIFETETYGHRSDADAFRWFRDAAELGNANAQYRVADAFERGTLVPKDIVEAYKWFNLAAAGSSAVAATQTQSASERRDRLAGLMTQELIALAQRKSSEWAARDAHNNKDSDASTSGTKRLDPRQPMLPFRISLIVDGSTRDWA